ncbi:MAG: hypothetical protein HWN69_07700 [Desulfobacterales bacterium]|nr:hypothetical protein [Desulfobacterales bacterium]
MSNETPIKVTLDDPLSEVSRRDRKFLLGSSILGITIVKAGFVPTKISALGIEFAKTDQNSLLLVLGIIILYFLIAFLIYASSDFLIWRLSYFHTLKHSMLDKWKTEAEKAPTKEMANYIDDFLKRGFPARIILGLTRPVSLLRAVFEFLLPIAFGIYAIIIVWSARIPIGGS